MSWPALDVKGTVERLRFPPFHAELLDQTWWNAGENLGRIKIVVSEGIDKGQGQGKVQFSPLTNLVCFSFQPAPIDVLEQSAIAWPNPGMWFAFSEAMSAARRFRSPGNLQSGPMMGSDSHAHSPRHRRPQTVGTGSNSGLLFPVSRPPTSLNMPDPFVDNQNLGILPNLDQSLGDGQNAIAGPSPRGNEVELRLPDDQLVRLVEALSPRTRSRYVTPSEQSNKVLPSSVEISSQPPILAGSLSNANLSATADTRLRISKEIFTGVGKSTTLWDSIHATQAPVGKHGRDSTDISMHMGCTDFPNCDHDRPHDTHLLTNSPSKGIGGKQEGSANKGKGMFIFFTIFAPTSYDLAAGPLGLDQH
ncbi:MAG: hypothetical protein M1821_001502 [Bathelium mastoideum]|nr:MAG: hypothetical protein M1821_001502 [Bathelium mastoideum]